MADKRPVVVIDPGHGGSDPGAIGAGGKPEKVYTLDQARAIGLALWRMGYTHVLTRYTDRRPTFKERTSLAGTAGWDGTPAACFISVHWNAFTDPDVRGTITICRRGREPDRKLAEVLLEQVKVVDGEQEERHDRLIEAPDPAYRGGRYVPPMLETGDVPSALLEVQFSSNPDVYEAIEAAGGSYYQNVGFAVASAVDIWWTEHMGRKPPTPLA